MISLGRFKVIQGHHILFAFLSFLILFDLLPSGYILTLDMVYTPKTVWSAQGFSPPYPDQNLPFRILIEFLGSIIQMHYIQKAILFLTLFIAGVSAYKLSCGTKTSGYFAGIIYMINPFVYERFLAGHLRLLMAYALLPIAVKLFIDLLENINNKNIIKSIIITALIGMFNIQILLFTLLIYMFLFFFKLLELRKGMPVNFKSYIKVLFLVFIGWGLISLYWILPFIVSDRNILTQFNDQDINLFSPKMSAFSTAFTVASMYGLWREKAYILVNNILPYWYVLFVFILFLTVHGFSLNYKDKKKGWIIKSFGTIAVIGLVLGSGVYGPFHGLFEWLFDNIFIFRGFRDSHKFVVLLVLAYSYLGALGVAEFEKGINDKSKFKKIIAIAVVILALMTPFIYSFTMFNGLWGQLKPTDYPTDWYEVNEFLNKDGQDFNVLFLPWHQYMDFKWVPNRDKRIANPSSLFFDKPVIQGENIEMARIYSQSSNTIQKYVEFLLANKDKITNFGNLIVPLNVKYILLTKEVDYDKYFFLFNQSDLELVRETENFYIFKNKNEVSKIYQVDNVTYIKDWNEILEKSEKEDITGNVYLIGNSSKDSQENSGKTMIEYEKESSTRYDLKENQTRKYLVFTEPYSESWELEGKKPLAAYGVINAYRMDENTSKEIKYEPFFKFYLPSYILSIFIFIVLIVFYLDFHRKILTAIKKITDAFRVYLH